MQAVVPDGVLAQRRVAQAVAVGLEQEFLLRAQQALQAKTVLAAAAAADSLVDLEL
jgi:hypothetical protein